MKKFTKIATVAVMTMVTAGVFAGCGLKGGKDIGKEASPINQFKNSIGILHQTNSQLLNVVTIVNRKTQIKPSAMALKITKLTLAVLKNKIIGKEKNGITKTINIPNLLKI